MSRKIIGVEKDRTIIRATALRIIREVVEKPVVKHKDARKDFLKPLKVNEFKRLEPMGFGLPQDDWWIFDPADCKPDLIWPLSGGYVCEKKGQYETLSFAQVNTITAKQARGYASRFSPFMVKTDYGMDDRGKIITASGIMSYIGGKWVSASKRVIWEGETPTRETNDAAAGEEVNLITSIALRHRYEWAVSIGLEHSPSVRFSTDATGVKELFKVRDLPEGRDRRAALMTWVEDHWRQERRDPEIETYVRKHLRGATAFSWRGMECELLPAPFDIEQRDILIAKRNNMRRAGEDKRHRVELEAVL